MYIYIHTCINYRYAIASGEYSDLIRESRAFRHLPLLWYLAHYIAGRNDRHSDRCTPRETSYRTRPDNDAEAAVFVYNTIILIIYTADVCDNQP